MNIDEIKEKWSQEDIPSVELPKSVNQLKAAQHPLDIIKRHMKKELSWQIIGLLFFAFGPLILSIKEPVHIGIYFAAYAMNLALSTYYFYGFSRFYRQIGIHSTESRDNLLEIYYELRINMERYNSFNFLLLPFVMTFFGLLLQGLFEAKKMELQHISSRLLIALAAVMILLMTILYILLILMWVGHFYGKYASKIKLVLDELKEE